MEMEFIAMEAPSSANGRKCKPSPSFSGLGDLHDDMLERVLVRLPPASYLRLRAVCRQWRAAGERGGRRQRPERNKSRMARTFGVNRNHLRARSGSMSSSSPRSALYNGRLPRRRASEHGT